VGVGQDDYGTCRKGGVMTKTYEVPVTFEMSGVVEIVAKSREEADSYVQSHADRGVVGWSWVRKMSYIHGTMEVEETE